jgi:hypothetical protein
MRAVKIVAVALVVAGILGLVSRAGVWYVHLYSRDPRRQAGPARVVGAGEADGQHPDLGWCGGDCGWRRAPASCIQEKRV